MFKKGNILHIPKYRFNDGEIKHTGKFLVILYNDNNVSIVASLTTSKNHIPDIDLKTGCIDVPDKQIHCYHFPKNKKICQNDFSFELNTFVYFLSNIFKEQISYYESMYNSKIEVIGTLLLDEYRDILYCAYKSKYLKMNIKYLLEKQLNELYNAE